MSISSLQLDAFMEVVKLGSFSLAAKSLFVTQSALSQRIGNLERELEAPLLIRGDKEIKMTETGEKLWRYGKGRDQLESQFHSEVSLEKGELGGAVNIGSFSTYTRSVLLPKISKIVEKHPKIHFNVESKEIRELAGLLKSGVFDFVFSTEPIKLQYIESLLIGSEKNVLIESSKGSAKGIYIDHDENDPTTKNFWDLQKKGPGEYRSIYFDEIYAIIDAVGLGLGRAIVPEHLVKGDKRVKILKNFVPLEVPIYLCFHKQPISTKLHSFLKDFFT